MAFGIGLTTQMKGNNGESLTKMASGNSTSTATSIWLSLIALTLQSRRKDSAKKNHIVFHHDNARPHVERRAIESIANKGWDLLPHPPYSPTVAPTDYHVRHSLKNWQTNKVYDDFDDLVADVKAWITSKNRDFHAQSTDCQANGKQFLKWMVTMLSNDHLNMF
ncbi:hypothetical protein RB195_018786 [Necator americanus]|uniref:Tc1-like transposase DDE domain-containing protein n=1 Tax=Necator americanus TaxID=51031 RepID=A0ABR1CDJ2_NECAM